MSTASPRVTRASQLSAAPQTTHFTSGSSHGTNQAETERRYDDDRSQSRQFISQDKATRNQRLRTEHPPYTKRSLLDFRENQLPDLYYDDNDQRRQSPSRKRRHFPNSPQRQDSPKKLAPRQAVFEPLQRDDPYRTQQDSEYPEWPESPETIPNHTDRLIQATKIYRQSTLTLSRALTPVVKELVNHPSRLDREGRQILENLRDAFDVWGADFRSADSALGDDLDKLK